jgi:hypothetical protein
MKERKKETEAIDEPFRRVFLSHEVDNCIHSLI